jgi:hypothetical protein
LTIGAVSSLWLKNGAQHRQTASGFYVLDAAGKTHAPSHFELKAGDNLT